ncbi:hypothetical protein ACJZ2D_009323 [Fusarium nematophilum]
MGPLSDLKYGNCSAFEHLKVEDTCGVCGTKFKHHKDHVILLYCKGYPTGEWKMVEAKFTYAGYLFQGDGLCLCTKKPGVEAPGCVILHSECFELASNARNLQQTDKYNTIGRLVSARRVDLASFEYGEPHYLTGEQTTFVRPPLQVREQFELSTAAMGEAGQILGLAGLKKLTGEIGVMIQSYSHDAPFWHLVKIMAVKMQVSAMPRGAEPMSFPVYRVKNWTRGEPFPNTAREAALPQVIRITIDSRGISKVEGLESFPAEFSARRLEGKRFVVDVASRFQGVMLHFKDGLSWLDRPSSHPGFQVWDTPTPPRALEARPSTLWAFGQMACRKLRLSSCAMFRENATYSSRFDTAELKICTGLTFVYEMNPERLYAIHAHTKASPSFTEKSLDTDTMMWFQTKLAGIVEAGPRQTTKVALMMYSPSPEMLVYDQESLPSQAVLGLHTKNDSPPPTILPALRPPPSGPDSYDRWSSASLDNVKGVHVYRCRRRGFRGMVIEYNNGAQRAVGECRLGYYRCTTWMKPSTMYWTWPNTTGRMRLVFNKNPATKKSPVEWRSAAVEGELHCWEKDKVWTDFQVLPAGSWDTVVWEDVKDAENSDVGG